MQTNQMALMQKVDTEAQTDGNNIFDCQSSKKSSPTLETGLGKGQMLQMYVHKVIH